MHLKFNERSRQKDAKDLLLNGFCNCLYTGKIYPSHSRQMLLGGHWEFICKASYVFLYLTRNGSTIVDFSVRYRRDPSQNVKVVVANTLYEKITKPGRIGNFTVEKAEINGKKTKHFEIVQKGFSSDNCSLMKTIGIKKCLL